MQLFFIFGMGMGNRMDAAFLGVWGGEKYEGDGRYNDSVVT